MFDLPFDFVAFVIAIMALIFARRAVGESNRLRARIEALETLAAGRPVTQAAPGVTATAPLQPDATAASEPVTATSEPAAIPAGPAMPPPLPPEAQQASQPQLPPAPAQAAGFEERIGTRWVVWIGGLTLALGGFFLVRYSIEAGLLGPGVRTLLGGLFALALLAAGEITRRKESISNIAALPVANIPAILTAAGTAVAFGTVYAAYALYDFLAPAMAFILLGAVALGTLAAALLHGPALAGLGIVGAFATPILVSSAKPDYWALYIYLAVVTAAAFALARARLWRWLAVTTIALAFLWILPGFDGKATLPMTFHVLAGFALAAALVVCGFLFGPSNEDGGIEPVSSGSLAAYLLGAALIVLGTSHSDTSLTGFSILVVAAIAVAWRAPAATAALPAAAAFVFIVFAEWAVRANPDLLVLPGGALPGMGGPAVTEGSVMLHLMAATAFGVLFSSAGFLAQGRSAHAAVPVIWSAVATFVPLALLVALYARIAHLDRSIPFAVAAIVIAGLFGVATESLSRRDTRPGLAVAIALFATATLGALALALTFALEKGWLTIALALMSLGTAWVSLQRPIPFLRTLSAILAGIVVLRIGYEPRIVGNAVGTTPVFNWLLWGYGIPALSFWGASVLMRRRGDDAPLRAVEAAAILFTVLLVMVEIRHAVNDGNVYAVPSLAEFALDMSALLAMAIGLERLSRRSGSIVHTIGAGVLTVLAGLIGVFGLLVLENPMFNRIDVGGLVINWLLPAYAIPAILLLLLSYACAGQRPRAWANTIAAGALVFALAYVSFQIRRVYHGPILTEGLTTDGEQYTYSIAWLTFGVILLGIGLAVDSERARLASAAVIGLTILKAFVVDMSTLTGVFRALSFIGLGLVLVVIGWLYQKILFRRQPSPPPVAPGA